MSDSAYPTPIHDHGPVDGERLKREFQQRQAQRRKEILERKKKLEAALKSGDAKALRECGPLYE